MISVYGYGSYFKGSSQYKDIDILITHISTDYNSCLEVIALKKSIVNEIEGADVTILSCVAESEFNFIQQSRAILLSEFLQNTNNRILTELFDKVRGYKNITRHLNGTKTVG
ncbi:Uncharacterised protein [Zhongshania aliphaticivorans]|uniref:Polymerase beta nucleotidyltransferase domain-containing protein n=2 Tax=Zhongshania aliphaticivorans TaxID=1470434 RepID=A0A5S9PPU9_9GAMM|nr:Uncharacterised protein [Zhongshania aliphaticivorans]CAA0106242.1 Uncharacterised protein [Zhongshania aliphaticivorans]